MSFRQQNTAKLASDQTCASGDENMHVAPIWVWSAAGYRKLCDARKPQNPL